MGGCCSNVYSLERILVSIEPEKSVGTAITFCQFIFVALASYSSNADFNGSVACQLYLKKRHIPLQKWLVSVILFLVVSLVNNMIWKLDISIPVHIVFRSGSTVISMAVGYLFGGKRYSLLQIASSLMVAFGAVIATMPDSWGESDRRKAGAKTIFGLGLLFLAAILSAFMGLYNEKLYIKYGPHWQESLFYSHFLALPFFAFTLPTLISEFKVLWSDRNYYRVIGDVHIPLQLVNILVNVSTQYICIKSVNKLSSQISSLSVAMVLVIRRFTSLIISVLIFDNHMNNRMITGCVIVFIGSIQYALCTIKYNTKKKID